jgi:hypothetical protein
MWGSTSTHDGIRNDRRFFVFAMKKQIYHLRKWPSRRRQDFFELPTRKSTEFGVTDATAAARHLGLRVRVQEELIIIQLQAEIPICILVAQQYISGYISPTV